MDLGEAQQEGQPQEFRPAAGRTSAVFDHVPAMVADWPGAVFFQLASAGCALDDRPWLNCEGVTGRTTFYD
jgi:hypothetical protein